MSHRSRLLAAVLLVAALAVPAFLQASGLPSPRTAAHDGGSLLHTSSWSLEGLLRMVHRFWIDEGGGLDPDGGTPPPGNSGDSGPSLDASGRANLSGMHASTHRQHGN
ncbi:MAG TPA: hypothetical protein VKU60_00965 [Chloroflexota bacterium]|nr:hypothetical protein [Chloroflexota bacterium]